MDYESLHWGASKTRSVTVRVPAATQKRIGKVAKISYVTRKGEQSTVWEHTFEKQPWLCVAERSRPHRAADFPLLQIGLVVDIHLAPGSGPNGANPPVILGGGASVSTDASGRLLVLTSPNTLQFQFADWGSELAVNDHGIVL